jgi:hypothetical protein
MPRHATERSLSVNALKKRSAGKSSHPRIVPEPAERIVVGIDGAFVKAGKLGRAKGISLRFSPARRGLAARRRGIRRIAGPGSKEAGASHSPALRSRTRHGFEDPVGHGLRRVVGTWFGKKCEHRLDWFHFARRIANRKGIPVSPYGDDFKERLEAHWAMNSMKWMLWNDGVDMAEFGMTRVRIGLFQHALAHPEANNERFESIEAKLDKLRSYLYANRESVRGYAEAYRNGERISTVHVETVNQLINWRTCKKHQMGWSRAWSPAIASRETRLSTGDWTGIPGIIQYRRISPPDPQVLPVSI